MNLSRHIPNTLTLINLFCGALGVLAMTNSLVSTALILMGISLVADIFDGMIARKLGIAGGIGVQLDSLADMVSFGVLPTMMLFYMGARYGVGSPGQQVIAIAAALNSVSAGFRLARFNIDTRDKRFFWGLATPAGAMLVAGWLWAQHIGKDFGLGLADFSWLGVIIPLILVAAYHLPVKLPGLKSPRGGMVVAFMLATATTIGLFTIGPISIPAGILIYYFLGVINRFVKIY